MRLLSLAFVSVILILLAVVSVRTTLITSTQITVADAGQLKLDLEGIAERLAGGIRHKTISSRDAADTDYAEFLRLHEYLKTTFPHVDAQRNAILAVDPYSISDSARKIHNEAFVADLHADSLLWARDLRDYNAHGHIDVPRLKRGGVDLQIFGVVTKVPMLTEALLAADLSEEDVGKVLGENVRRVLANNLPE